MRSRTELREFLRIFLPTLEIQSYISNLKEGILNELKCR